MNLGLTLFKVILFADCLAGGTGVELFLASLWPQSDKHN